MTHWIHLYMTRMLAVIIFDFLMKIVRGITDQAVEIVREVAASFLITFQGMRTYRQTL